MTEVMQKVQLVEGTFTPSEASDVINGLIEEKINFHKIQRLAINEKCETDDTSYANGRIDELYEEKLVAKEIINEARAKGLKIRINGSLEITFV